MYVKKFSLYALLIFNASYIFSMQPPTPTPKPSGWGWRPFIPDTFALEEKTAETIKEAFKDIKDVAETLAKTAQHLSEGLTTSTNSAGVALHASVNELSKMLTTVSHQVVEKGVGLNAETLKTIQQSVGMITQALNPIAANGLAVHLDQDATRALQEICKTLQPLADKGLVAHVGADTLREINNVSRALNTVAQNGITTKLSIDPATLKTFFVASGGLTILTASIILIYKELTKPMQLTSTDAIPAKKSWLQTVKSLAQNRYLIGTTGIISGLLLIAKSNRIAMAY